jgi:hypothetical protein
VLDPSDPVNCTVRRSVRNWGPHPQTDSNHLDALFERSRKILTVEFTARLHRLFLVSGLVNKNFAPLNFYCFRGGRVLHFKKMQVLSMFRSSCARRFAPKIIIIRIERGETIKGRRERGEGLFVFGLWSGRSDRCWTVKGAETASG